VGDKGKAKDKKEKKKEKKENGRQREWCGNG
jgi:hypothetical protein